MMGAARNDLRIFILLTLRLQVIWSSKSSSSSSCIQVNVILAKKLINFYESKDLAIRYMRMLYFLDSQYRETNFFFFK